MKNSDIVVGVLSGLAVGALLGVLFAPDKGVETRKKISDEGKKIADKVKHKFQKEEIFPNKKTTADPLHCQYCNP